MLNAKLFRPNQIHISELILIKLFLYELLNSLLSETCSGFCAVKHVLSAHKKCCCPHLNFNYGQLSCTESAFGSHRNRSAIMLKHDAFFHFPRLTEWSRLFSRHTKELEIHKYTLGSYAIERQRSQVLAFFINSEVRRRKNVFSIN